MTKEKKAYIRDHSKGEFIRNLVFPALFLFLLSLFYLIFCCFNLDKNCSLFDVLKIIYGFIGVYTGISIIRFSVWFDIQFYASVDKFNSSTGFFRGFSLFAFYFLVLPCIFYLSVCFVNLNESKEVGLFEVAQVISGFIGISVGTILPPVLDRIVNDINDNLVRVL